MLQFPRYGASADDEVLDVAQPLSLLGNLQRVPHLQGYHGGKVNDTFIERRQCVTGKGMTRWLHGEQFHIALQGTHHHHLSGDVVQRHTEKGGVGRMESQEVARHSCACAHAFLFYIYEFGSARTATCAHLHSGRGIVPLGKEIVNGHTSSTLARHILEPCSSMSISMLSV